VTRAVPESKKPSISIFRKILVWTFVIGVWIVFYWYQDYKQSNKKSVSAPMPPAQIEPLTTKK